MLTEAHRDRIEVVLVSPRNPLNIGAAARAMANFGFSRLTLVAPYEPHWREARSAVGADALLQNAKVSTTLAEAVADCTLVVGTGTATRRKAEQPVIALPALAPLVGYELDRGGRVALVFGPEKHGLTREDLSYCHRLVAIPTDARQPSMNLGQAVAVFLYELAVRMHAPGSADESAPAPAGTAGETGSRQSAPAGLTSGHLELLAGAIENVMLAANYSPPSMRRANRHDLRLLLRRLALTQRDARRILGFFRRVYKQLQPGEPPPKGERVNTEKC
ncbi:MAG: RNA methyltransferase [Terracidiphilus sp.]